MEKHIIRTLFYDFVNGEVLDIAADDFDLAEHFLCQFGSSVECTLFLDNLFYALLCCLTASASADCNNLNVVPARSVAVTKDAPTSPVIPVNNNFKTQLPISISLFITVLLFKNNNGISN